ncbi:MAG: ribbon-helix-helix protein, CopG family [Oscillospiraceae bacterium]|nr:ribbon-helix-helix protein, CopG family [Candidatus Limimonas egerieequi]
MDKFSPKKIDKEIISIRVSVDLLKRVDDEATKADISRNEMINQCIDYALGHLEKQ